MPNTEQILTGAAIFGQAMKGNAFALIDILDTKGNERQEAVACFLYYQEFKCIPDSEEALIAARDILATFQNSFRRALSESVLASDHRQRSTDADAMKFRMNQEVKALAKQHQENSKPTEYGTIAEIAAKYGLSKSEIRRAKAEGKLDELIRYKENKVLERASSIQ